MLEFTKLDKDVLKIKDYFDQPHNKFCDLTVGVKYMWRKDYVIDYAFFGDTLILKESCPDYKDAFYFPLFLRKDINDESHDDYQKKLKTALKEIESYCTANNLPLLFCCIDDYCAASLSEIYPFCSITPLRDWSDYVYPVENFITYAGKKLSGQRNHLNRFRREYPSYTFKIFTQNDVPKIKRFLSEFESENSFSYHTAEEEESLVHEYVENAVMLGQVGGYIEIEGKVVSVSFGEVVGDTLVAHVEKALKEYDGVYPATAHEFAKAFATKAVKYINREEDCGDMGLRTSKLQYHPLEIKNKNLVLIKTAFDNIKPPIIIKTDRLLVSEVSESVKTEYAELCTNLSINRFWGYDFRTEVGKDTPNGDYFYQFQQNLKHKKEEYALGVYLENALIGEIVLWNFSFDGSAEIGFRFLEKYQKMGFGYESSSAVMDFAVKNLKISFIKARCHKINEKSLGLLSKLGFKICREDEKFFYFEKP